MKRAVLLLVMCLLCFTGCGTAGEIYRVEVFDGESEALEAPLYVATIEMPESCGDVLGTHGISVSRLGAPVAVFSVEGSVVEPSGIFRLPNIGGSGISGFYILSENFDATSSLNYSRSGTEKLHALAGKTSENTPLYLVCDGQLEYAVIGDTAYYIGYVIFEPLPEQLTLSLPDAVDVAVLSVE